MFVCEINRNFADGAYTKHFFSWNLKAPGPMCTLISDTVFKSYSYTHPVTGHKGTFYCTVN
jgi:hypothetical protein